VTVEILLFGRFLKFFLTGSPRAAILWPNASLTLFLQGFRAPLVVKAAISVLLLAA
jgi:hypothetical protein